MHDAGVLSVSGYQNRWQYTPTGPAARLMRHIDSGTSAAADTMDDLPDQIKQQFNYLVHHPIKSLLHEGQYIEAVATAVWNALRNGLGAMNGSLNLITRTLAADCDDSYTLYVETALPAIGQSMMLWVVPSPEQILQNYLRPYPSKETRRPGRGGRASGRGHGKSGRKRRRFPEIPDPDHAIANMLPGRIGLAGRDIGLGQKFIWSAIDAADIVGLAYLVADTLETGANVWTSGVYNARKCHYNPGGWYRYDPGFAPRDTWYAFTPVDSESEQKNMTYNTFYYQFSPPGHPHSSWDGMCSATGTYFRLDLGGADEVTVTMWFEITRSDGSSYVDGHASAVSRAGQEFVLSSSVLVTNVKTVEMKSSMGYGFIATTERISEHCEALAWPAGYF